MMETYTDVRKRLEVEEKHERAAYYKKVDACVKNRKRYRKKNPKNYKPVCFMHNSAVKCAENCFVVCKIQYLFMLYRVLYR